MLARLDVGDPHLHPRSERPQFVRQLCRMKVTAHFRKSRVGIAKGGLDDQAAHRQLREPLPQCRVRPGVAAVDPGRPGRIGAGEDGHADGRHRVARRQHLQCPPAQHDALPHRQRHERQHRPLGRGQPREVGPDHAVEDVLLQRLQRLGQRMHPDRRARSRHPATHHAVGEQRDGQHMVQMRMAEHDVVDARHLLERELAHARARIEQHALVEQKGGGAVARGERARTPQHADTHAPAPAPRSPLSAGRNASAFRPARSGHRRAAAGRPPAAAARSRSAARALRRARARRPPRGASARPPGGRAGRWS